MYKYIRLLPQSAAVMLVLSGCATRYDNRLVEQRSQQLYQATRAPALEAQPSPGSEALFKQAVDLKAPVRERLALLARSFLELRPALRMTARLVRRDINVFAGLQRQQLVQTKLIYGVQFALG